MADKGAPRTGRERIKTLAQAALNADLTVEQVDTVLNNLMNSLSALDIPSTDSTVRWRPLTAA